MSTLIQGPDSLGQPMSTGNGLYTTNWTTALEAPAGKTIRITHIEVANKRPRVQRLFSRWTDKGQDGNPTMVQKGPVFIDIGDVGYFAEDMVLKPGDVYQLRTDEADSCDFTVVYTLL